MTLRRRKSPCGGERCPRRRTVPSLRRPRPRRSRVRVGVVVSCARAAHDLPGLLRRPHCALPDPPPMRRPLTPYSPHVDLSLNDPSIHHAAVILHIFGQPSLLAILSCDAGPLHPSIASRRGRDTYRILRCCIHHDSLLVAALAVSRSPAAHPPVGYSSQ
ncbi:hypothetical protein B0H12DRAFT_179009 [Mycena haematopus]|nr:hypothetical protein B0H12DRAFT_179009 [Mycena haematopus]